jgi:hypothetical protein
VRLQGFAAHDYRLDYSLRKVWAGFVGTGCQTVVCLHMVVHTHVGTHTHTPCSSCAVAGGATAGGRRCMALFWAMVLVIYPSHCYILPFMPWHQCHGHVPIVPLILCRCAVLRCAVSCFLCHVCHLIRLVKQM